MFYKKVCNFFGNSMKASLNMKIYIISLKFAIKPYLNVRKYNIAKFSYDLQYLFSVFNILILEYLMKHS